MQFIDEPKADLDIFNVSHKSLFGIAQKQSRYALHNHMVLMYLNKATTIIFTPNVFPVALVSG